MQHSDQPSGSSHIYRRSMSVDAGAVAGAGAGIAAEAADTVDAADTVGIAGTAGTAGTADAAVPADAVACWHTMEAPQNWRLSRASKTQESSSS
ncbi:hypothetical protein FGG08_006566 [Glutinoglossum americanum]|uniref:Uncharacterized protein n=1 Tax=Glutinoglossum americanum TaxID=1670608 RepID=A0A9P8HVT0_9PEZI|nr:hypothetical protein FGG08_006566 [Glutinoglossum americanum]